MTPETTTVCACGSGRPPRECHEMPARLAFAAREELQALGEAHAVAAFFPWLRPEPGVLDDLIALTVRRLGDREDVEDDLHAAVEEAIDRLSEDELRAPSLAWRGRHPDRWRRLLRAVRGDEAALERCFAGSAVRAAIVERMPFDPSLADELDDFPSSIALSGALSLVITPGLVWERDDAALALDAFPRFRMDELEIAERYAPSIVTDVHLERVRTQVAHVAAALPLEGRDRASRLLERAVREVSADEEHQFHLACMLLQAYASSLWHQEVRRVATRNDRSFRTWHRGPIEQDA